MNYRARLYNAYATQQVQVTPERLPAALNSGVPYFRRLLKWLPSNKDARILDLGCGYGSLLHFLRSRGYSNLGGVDVSPEQVALAHQAGLSFVRCGDIRDALLGAPEHSVQCVIAFDVFEHLTRDELLEMGDLIYRVLAPGGRLIVHVPNAAGLFSGVIRYGDLTHESAFTPRSLTQLGNACGLRMVAVREDTPVAHGVVSGARYALWKVATFPLRILFLSESPIGFDKIVLSQNMLAVFEKEVGS
jgi:SAM-dependent methyltransferase